MNLKVKQILIAFCFISVRCFTQDISDANMKAILIYQFAKYTIWENEENIAKFRIGIYGNNAELHSELKIIESVKLKDKPVEILNFSDIDDIDSIHLLYVTPGNNIELKRITNKISGKNTLLVSDQCNDESIIMINFLPLKGKKVQFEVNKANIYYENLNVMPELLLLGGTEIDIAELYKESQKSLMEVSSEADSLGLIAEEQYKIIEQRNIDILAQNEIIKRQKKEIVEDQEKINKQEQNLKKLVQENEVQQEAVNTKIRELREHEIEFENQQNEIIEQRKILKDLNSEVKNKQAQIVQQRSTLTSYQTKVEKRNTILFILIPFTLLVLILIFFLHKAYRIKRQVNKKIFQQRDEILAQAVELQKANDEVVSINAALESQKEELSATLDHLKKTQSQLVQTAKMASLGKLTAGVAHELNNPINFINGNVSPLKRDINEIYEIINKYDAIVENNKLENKFTEVESLKEKYNYTFLVEEINSLLEGINEGATRTSNIVLGLRSFSRLDEDEFIEADIHELIESTLTVLKNKTKNRITLHKSYGKIGLIECLPSKLNQVFMNILMNGIQAIEGEGDIFITTSVDNGFVKISLRDTGKGIPKEVKKHIFEPFYTTKEVGQGTGLGLSISFGIIQKHNGTIEIESETGEGAEFLISIPVRQVDKSREK